MGDDATTTTLYVGLRNACTAASDKDPAKWKDAQKSLDAVGSVAFCADKLALGLLARLVDAHHRFPNARIRFTAPTVTPQKACSG
ncbi:hypothetical protein [Actinocrispum wychmicini]|uniref:hypothetical protein n=1 Tax=Actinocrispum wychmicini TaxID=1213861 RepID=UPI001045A202|nr:hypothetical protein [Actinocrispum wychmicini]